ncbi:MAG: hypothetical protein U0T77_10580 [Chitinophagales bacterium]
MITDTQIQTAKQSIEKLLNISPEQHNEILFDCGIGFCETVYKPATPLYEHNAYGADFWNWWTSAWHKRNYELLLSIKAINESGELVNYSIDNHYMQHTFVSTHMNAAVQYYPSKAFAK